MWATVYELATAGYPELPSRAMEICKACGIAAVSPAGARLLAPGRRKQQYSEVVLISGRGQSRHDVYSAVFDGRKASASSTSPPHPTPAPPLRNAEQGLHLRTGARDQSDPAWALSLQRATQEREGKHNFPQR